MAGSNAKIILASRSVARREMLEKAGVDFESIAAGIDEAEATKELLEGGAKPEDIAGALARRKALQVAKDNPEALVIGSDQVLVCEGALMGKAKSAEEAREKLKMLRGKTHELFSAVCVAQGGEVLWEECESAKLTMKDFDDNFLDAYTGVAGKALTRSAGAYEIENEGLKLFSDVKGDTHVILGMPLDPLLDYLEQQHGVRV